MSQLQTSNWSDTPANNNAATPNGWPEGQNPDTVNDCAREMMSALKINFNHVHGLDSAGALLSSGGTSTAYTVTYSTAPATLYTGFLFGFKVHTTCGAAPTVNVNALGAVNIQKQGAAGLVNLIANDLVTGMFALCRYDATLAKAILLTPVAAVECFAIAASDETTAITTGTAKATFRMPYAFTVTDVRATLTTASTSGTPTIDINDGGTTIISTKITIDANEKTSTTAAIPPVISDTALADDAEITIDVDVAGTSAKGLKVYIIGRRT